MLNSGIFLAKKDDIIVSWFEEALHDSKHSKSRYNNVIWEQKKLQEIFDRNSTVRDAVYLHLPHTDLQVLLRYDDISVLWPQSKNSVFIVRAVEQKWLPEN